jgi:hypothetical protein
MNDRFHVDHYTGRVRDRTDSLANDAYVAVLGLVHSGKAVVRYDASHGETVPTVRHATHPGLHATIAVDRYDSDTRPSLRGSIVCVTVTPSKNDRLKTSLRIMIEEPGSLYADDASEMGVALVVVETAAVHYALAVEACRKRSPDTITFEDRCGPEIEFDMDHEGSPMLLRASETAAIAALNHHADARTVVTMPTPWNGLKAFTRNGDIVETDEELALRVPVMIDFETRYAFSDREGRGTSGIIVMRPVRKEVVAVDPMDRLRAMRNARNGTGDSMRLHVEPDQATIRALCA